MKFFLKLVLLAIALTTISIQAETIITNKNNSLSNESNLAQNVKNKLLAEPALAGMPITISVVDAKQGLIALTGTLNTDEQASKAIEIASAFPGVQDVDVSSLTVKDSKQPLTDTAITAKVKTIFLREKLFGEMQTPVISIAVETKNGIVYLSGTAENQAQIDKAIALAKSIKNVVSVDSKVIVK